MRHILKTLSLSALSLALTTTATAASNIDPHNLGQLYGWTENGGWINMEGDDVNGVRVKTYVLEGYAWHENFGWINFGDGTPAGQQYSNTTAEDFGVNMDPEGNLSGYAWGENVGWINFDSTGSGGARVSIDQPTGRFKGYAWGENVGWIAFETVPQPHVAHTVGYSGARNWDLY